MTFTTPEDLLPRIEAGDATITSQEIFDAVVTHLGRQKERSVTSEWGCVYSSPDGLKCAVGALIPASFYSSDMEEKDVKALSCYASTRGWHNLEAFLKNNISTLVILQGVHDINPESSWWKQLRLAGRSLRLELGAVEEFFPEPVKA
jgi:hypothetical protein